MKAVIKKPLPQMSNGTVSNLYDLHTTGEGPVEYDTTTLQQERAGSLSPMTPWLPKSQTRQPDYKPLPLFRDVKLGRAKMPTSSEGMHELLRQQKEYNMELMRARVKRSSIGTPFK